MQWRKKVHYVFIVNEKYLPNPHLVELGRRKSPRIRDVLCFAPNVLFCPQTMLPLLIELKNKSSNIKDHHRMLIYEEYISTLKQEETQELDKRSTSFWRAMAIGAIIDFEIDSKMQFNCKMETRSFHLSSR